MAKTKLKLDELQVQSFVTNLDDQQLQQTKGGIYVIRGMRYQYNVRWTSIDTRADVEARDTRNISKGL